MNNFEKIAYCNAWYKISVCQGNTRYRGADKSLSDPTKKTIKSRHFSSDVEVIAAAETWLDGQPSDFFF